MMSVSTQIVEPEINTDVEAARRSYLRKELLRGCRKFCRRVGMVGLG